MVLAACTEKGQPIWTLKRATRSQNELRRKSGTKSGDKENKIMLAISLMRMGAKKRPFYRVVVKEKRSKRDGKYLENVGTYDPLQNPAEVKSHHDRIQYWIGLGAQPTD